MQTMVRPPRTGKAAFEMLPEGTLCQLINDAIIMSPAPNTPHARLQNLIFNSLYYFVEKNKLGEAFCAPVDVYLNDKNIYQPDIFFIDKTRLMTIKERGIYGAPDLVIEILSSDRQYDLVVKKEVYELAGVKEYWVVDPKTKWCEGFVLENGQYETLGESTGTFILQIINLPVTF